MVISFCFLVIGYLLLVIPFFRRSAFSCAKVLQTPCFIFVKSVGLFLVTVFLSLGFSVSLSAQGGFNPSNFGRSSGGGGGAPNNDELARDTTDVFYFYINNPGQEYQLSDTLIESYFLQYDPTRRQNLPYAHLGLPGTAAYPLTYQIQRRQGIFAGFSQYDLYRHTVERLKFYEVEQAYTRAGFSQGLTQQETTFDAEFARQFAGNLTLSFDYRRMGNTGFYENQEARNSALAVNAWLHSDNNRYHAFFTTIFNKNDQQENGGISELPQNESLTRDTVDNPLLATTFLSSTANAQSRYRESIYDFRQSFKLNRNQVDSSGRGTRAITVMHQSNYRNNIYKFSDIAPADGADFYGQFQTDERGVRHYLQVHQIENKFSVNTFKTQKDSTQLNQQKDLLELGILHRFNSIQQEPRTFNVQEVFALGRWQIAPGKRLKLNTYAHLGLLGSIGDYELKGDLSFDLGKAGQLEAHAFQQLTRPSIIADSFFVSQRQVYGNEFRKSLNTEIGGSYSLPLVGFQAEVNYQLLDNFIYFDTLALPQQADAPISVGRLTIRQDFKLGSFRSENQVTLQQTSSDLVRIPPVYSINSLFVEGNLLKGALFAKLGFDLRLNAPFRPYAYQPLTGQFHLQDQQETNWQPVIDVFFAAKIKKVRVMVRYDNFLPMLTRTDYYYHTSDYPLAHGYLRWAVSWQFVD